MNLVGVTMRNGSEINHQNDGFSDRRIVRIIYGLSWLFAVLFLVTNGRFGGAGFLLPLLCLPLSVRTIRTAVRVYRERPESPPWRGLERASGLVHFIFGLLYAAAWALKH